MATKPRYYLTTAISYPNGVPHIGHAYEAIATDAIARFLRLDGHDVFFMTGVDEHGMKMSQTAAKEGITPRALADRNSARFREMCDRLDVSYDRFIRTTEPAHYEASQAIWKKHGRGRRHLYRHLSGLVLGARRGVLRRRRDHGRPGQRARRPAGHAGRVDRGEVLFLPPLGLSGPVAQALRGPPGFRAAGDPLQRGHQLRQSRAAGPLDLAHHARLGRAGARCARSRDVRVGRRAHQLPDRRRLSGCEVTAIQALAGRFARHRQGHRALPRGLLAGVPDFGGPGAAQTHLQPRLSLQSRGENVEVRGQRGRSVRARRRLWRRCAALFLPARGAVRPGRQLQPRDDRRAHERGPRQRSGQPCPTLALDGGQELRGQGAEARRAVAGRQGHPRRRRRHAWPRRAKR